MAAGSERKRPLVELAAPGAAGTRGAALRSVPLWPRKDRPDRGKTGPKRAEGCSWRGVE